MDGVHSRRISKRIFGMGRSNRGRMNIWSNLWSNLFYYGYTIKQRNFACCSQGTTLIGMVAKGWRVQHRRVSLYAGVPLTAQEPTWGYALPNLCKPMNSQVFWFQESSPNIESIRRHAALHYTIKIRTSKNIEEEDIHRLLNTSQFPAMPCHRSHATYGTLTPPNHPSIPLQPHPHPGNHPTNQPPTNKHFYTHH